ncbi:MAG: S8 family serine peptidase [Proteobacteria bacterium]|nr:S8 family serine peptidase [Pseudomonadota bacterium]
MTLIRTWKSPQIFILIVGLGLSSIAGATSEPLGVIVQTAKPYDAVVAGIEGLGGTVTIQYVNADAIAAQIPADRFADLMRLNGVDAVEKDMIVELSTPNGKGRGRREKKDTTVEPSTPSAPNEQTRRQALRADNVQLLDGDAAAAMLGGDLPDNYYSYLSQVTGAQDTWAATGAGADSLVAVIDTGTDASHICLAGRVLAGPDFSTDQGTSFEGSTLSSNHFHGTFVGGTIATGNGCAILDALVGGLFTTHLPPNAFFDGGGFAVIPLLGIAPEAHIYAVKVFPHTGAGASSSRINAAIDHVITQKLSGALDIDVVNMSLGGASLFDGRTVQEMLVDAGTDAGITFVISSGNEGPTPNSVARPSTAYSAVTVAAATDPVHTRIFWDLIFGPGQGLAMYPTDERRVADFSSRGPSADGRNAVDIIATGVFNFSLFPGNGLGWASGTSFSAPQIAGAAALLNAWAENNDPSIGPQAIKNALMDGAVSVNGDWSEDAQGQGFLNVPNSLAFLQSGHVNDGSRHDSNGALIPNILLGVANEHTETITLGRGRTQDFVFKIDENTEQVEVIVDVPGAIPAGPGAIPNSWELYIKSAKHGGTGYLLDTANIFDDASVVIGDGTVDQFGAIGGGVVSPAPMEPGLMKVTLEPDWTNNTGTLTATITIRRTQGLNTSNAGGTTGTIGDGDFGCFAFNVPGGTSEAVIDLSWKHNWSKVPTNDLDMLFASPSSLPSLDFTFLDGATLNAPERQVIGAPEAGLWFVCVNGFAVFNGRDPFDLSVTLND